MIVAIHVGQLSSRCQMPSFSTTSSTISTTGPIPIAGETVATKSRWWLQMGRQTEKQTGWQTGRQTGSQGTSLPITAITFKMLNMIEVGDGDGEGADVAEISPLLETLYSRNRQMFIHSMQLW